MPTDEKSEGSTPLRTTLVMAWWIRLEPDSAPPLCLSPLMRLPRLDDLDAPAWLSDFSLENPESLRIPGLASEARVPKRGLSGSEEKGFAAVHPQRRQEPSCRPGTETCRELDLTSQTGSAEGLSRAHVPESIEPAWELLGGDVSKSRSDASALWSHVPLPPLRFFLRHAEEIKCVYSA